MGVCQKRIESKVEVKEQGFVVSGDREMGDETEEERNKEEEKEEYEFPLESKESDPSKERKTHFW